MTLITTIRDVYSDLVTIRDAIATHLESFDEILADVQNNVLAQVVFEVKKLLEKWLLKFSFLPDSVTDIIKARIVLIETWFTDEFDITPGDMELFDKATAAYNEIRNEIDGIFARMG